MCRCHTLTTPKPAKFYVFILLANILMYSAICSVYISQILNLEYLEFRNFEQLCVKVCARLCFPTKAKTQQQGFRTAYVKDLFNSRQTEPYSVNQ